MRLSKPADAFEERLKEAIQKVFRESRSTYGIRSMRRVLPKEGFKVGKKRICRLRRLMKLVATPCQSNPYATLKVANDAKVCKHRLSPKTHISRLADIVPAPRRQVTVYSGVLVSNSKWPQFFLPKPEEVVRSNDVSSEDEAETREILYHLVHAITPWLCTLCSQSQNPKGIPNHALTTSPGSSF